MRVHVYVREGERIKVAVAWFGSHPPGDKGDNKEEIFDKHAVFWHMSILKISFKNIKLELNTFSIFFAKPRVEFHTLEGGQADSLTGLRRLSKGEEEEGKM